MPRQSRTAVGQLRDGRLVLVVADGGQPGYSVGMTNFELAATLVRLGVQTGAALGSGASSTMAFDGALLNRPSAATGEAAIADALLVTYDGVYAPLPPAPVLSPNGDGVGESETLAYKLVRPSIVTAQLLGPDGRIYVSDSGQRQPGMPTFVFPGPELSPAALPEGAYRWLVTATDDLGRSSSDRTRLPPRPDAGTADGRPGARPRGTRRRHARRRLRRDAHRRNPRHGRDADRRGAPRRREHDDGARARRR